MWDVPEVHGEGGRLLDGVSILQRFLSKVKEDVEIKAI